MSVLNEYSMVIIDDADLKTLGRGGTVWEFDYNQLSGVEKRECEAGCSIFKSPKKVVEEIIAPERNMPTP